MTSLQEQARALGDPTRHRIFRYLVDVDRPVGVAELTEAHGVNHNAIRQHLTKLVGAGLVTEATAPPSGPGRPRLVYRVAPDVDSRWGVESPYERLSRMLADVIRTGRSPRDIGRDEGRERQVAGGADLGEQLEEAMARAGFDPNAEVTGRRIELVLRRCPFESTAVADPATVCALHLGIAEGLTDGIDEVEQVDLVARDPRRADCILRFELRAD
jgi:predicted ArsR family transcriptional regulator